MRRRAVIVAVWVAGTVASVALAWTAVSAVGGEVTSTPPNGAALAAEEPASTTSSSTSTTTTTAAAPSSTTTTGAPVTPTTSAAAAPAPSPTTTATTSPPPPPAERRSGVFDSNGGTVGASCTGPAASLDFATPRAGYAAEVHDTGPDKVEVRFDAGSGTESRVEVRCVDGTPTAAISEND